MNKKAAQSSFQHTKKKRKNLQLFSKKSGFFPRNERRKRESDNHNNKEKAEQSNSFFVISRPFLKFFPHEQFRLGKKCLFISLNWLKRFFNEIIKEIYRSSMFSLFSNNFPLCVSFENAFPLLFYFIFFCEKLAFLWVVIASCTNHFFYV